MMDKMTDPLPQRPRLKPHVDVRKLGPESVILQAPGLFARYSGEGVAALLDVLPHLDGREDVAGIARRAGRSVEDVRDVVEALLADRAVEDAAQDELHALPPETRARFAEPLALFSHLTTNPARAMARLSRARVLIVGEGALADAIAQTLEASGIGRVERGDVAVRVGADHVVVASARPDPSRMLAANEACLETRTPWTAVLLDGLDAFLGPTVLPRETACWRCYDLRVKGAHPNMDRLMAFEASASATGRPLTRAAFPSFDLVAGAWTAQAVLASVARVTLPPLAGKVVHVDLLGMRATPHRVLRLPRCPACSPASVPDVDRYALEPVGLG